MFQSIKAGAIPEFVTVKVSQDLNLMWNMSTQWNQQLSRYVSKVIECLEQNIRKQIDCKRLPNTKQMNSLQYIHIFELKYGNTKLLGNTKHD